MCSPGRVRFKDLMMRDFLGLDTGKLEVQGITRFIRCWLVLWFIAQFVCMCMFFCFFPVPNICYVHYSSGLVTCSPLDRCSVWKNSRPVKTLAEWQVTFAIQMCMLQHPELSLDMPLTHVLDVEKCLSWRVVRTLFHTLHLKLHQHRLSHVVNKYSEKFISIWAKIGIPRWLYRSSYIPCFWHQVIWLL